MLAFLQARETFFDEKDNENEIKNKVKEAFLCFPLLFTRATVFQLACISHPIDTELQNSAEREY